MRAGVLAAVVLMAAPAAAQQRGAVARVETSAPQMGEPVRFTVTGTNPCGAVRIDYGDGNVVTHPITGVPATITHVYDRPGTYRVAAEGMGNCDGRVEGTARSITPAAPAPEAVRRGAQGRANGLDRNGDGVITRSEWRGNDRSFEVHDRNRDGVLSGTEATSAIEAPDLERGESVDRARLTDWTERRFRDLDANDDGRVTQAEWRYEEDQFRRADRNGDGRLVLSEFLGEATGTSGRTAGGLADARFAELDDNRDGIISRSEWQGVRAAFADRDANGDGVITRPEFEDGDRREDDTRSAAVVTVDAATRWTDTGIFVRRGELVRFDADGTVRLSTDRRDVADASGARTGRRADNAPVNDALAGSLIARVGGSAPFLVGGEGPVRMPQDGELRLGVNDDYLDDNAGVFRVTIRPRQR
jgi:Ca2+-binding EF-hand superfamily protein